MKPLLIQYSNEKIIDGQKVSFGIQAEVEAEEAYDSAVTQLKTKVDEELNRILPNPEKEKIQAARAKLQSVQNELQGLLGKEPDKEIIEEQKPEVVDTETLSISNDWVLTNTEFKVEKEILELLKKAHQQGLLNPLLEGKISNEDVELANTVAETTSNLENNQQSNDENMLD